MKNMLIALCAVVAIGFFVFQINGINKTGINFETSIMADEDAYKAVRSEYENGFFEMLGVKDTGVKEIHELLKATASARYEAGSSAQRAALGGQLVSAVREAYPNLDRLTGLTEKVMDYVKTGREKIKQAQLRRIEESRKYQNFLKGGLLQPFFCGLAGLPSDNLEAVNAEGKTLTGMDALKHLATPIVTAGTDDAARTRRDAPLTAPASK